MPLALTIGLSKMALQQDASVELHYPTQLYSLARGGVWPLYGWPSPLLTYANVAWLQSPYPYGQKVKGPNCCMSRPQLYSIGWAAAIMPYTNPKLRLHINPLLTSNPSPLSSSSLCFPGYFAFYLLPAGVDDTTVIHSLRTLSLNLAIKCACKSWYRTSTWTSRNAFPSEVIPVRLSVET